MNAKTVAQAVMDDSVLWREITYGPEETTEYVSLEVLRSCIEERAAPLDAEIARLRAALANYGRHLDNCPLSWKDEGACECGLDVALEEG